jgi:hypothetical protein
VTVATALVMDDVDPDAFNANVAAVDAFRRAVASSLASVASADDVVNVVASRANRRRLSDDLAGAARVDFDLLVSVANAANATAAETAAVAAAEAELTESVEDGSFDASLDEEKAGDEAAAEFYGDAAVAVEASTDVIAAETAGAGVSVLTAAPTASNHTAYACACLPAAPSKVAADSCRVVCTAH